MNDRAVSVLENYDLNLVRVNKGRGSLICETEQGLKILKEYSGREERIFAINPYLEALKTREFLVETYTKNKDGFYICKDREQKTYILKDYFEGTECQVQESDDLLRAFTYLGKLQMQLCELEILPAEEMPARDLMPKQDNEDVTEKENCNLSDENADCKQLNCEQLNVLEFNNLNKKNNDYNIDKERQDDLIKNRTTRLCQEIAKKNRELKHIHKYLRGKNSKSEFEEFLQHNFGQFYKQAEFVEKELVNKNFEEKMRGKAILCHGDFQYHNLLFTNQGLALINFEKMQFDDASKDLTHFFRKVMEKTDWNQELAIRLLDNYFEQYHMSEDEYDLFLCRLSYPEKFRKTVNYYMNSKKTVHSDKNMEKLRKILAQETARLSCISFLQDYKKQL